MLAPLGGCIYSDVRLAGRTHDTTRDGRWLIIDSHSEERPRDILRYDSQANPERPLDLDKFEVVVGSPSQEGSPRVSPDGRWMTYQSLETGTFEIYLCDNSSHRPADRQRVDGGQ